MSAQNLRMRPYVETGSLLGNSVKMRSYWVRVGTESDMTGVLIRTETHTDIHRGKTAM